MRCKYTPGDWVRFMCCGSLVIGRVEYIDKVVTGFDIYTDIGMIGEEEVLERRKNSKKSGDK